MTKSLDIASEVFATYPIGKEFQYFGVAMKVRYQFDALIAPLVTRSGQPSIHAVYVDKAGRLCSHAFDAMEFPELLRMARESDRSMLGEP